jgi:hypothetical protein
VTKKLQRIRANPRVALAYHTREHGWTNRPEYVLVQGRAKLSAPHPRYMDTIRENFAFYGGGLPGYPGEGLIWGRWLRGWHYRMGIELAVERIVVWPDLGCSDVAQVHGEPLPPAPPPAQKAPGKGTGPRLDAERAASKAARKPDVLLGWVGADGLPVVVPVEVVGHDEGGIALSAPEGLVPQGGRRAGLTAHSFGEYLLPHHQRIHTGWLECREGHIAYAPHTRAGYYMPRSKLIYKIAAGAATNRGLREALRQGLLATGDAASEGRPA